MGNGQKKYVESGSSDPRIARTKDNALGIDDIGLPADVLPDGASKLEEIKSDPEQIQSKS